MGICAARTADAVETGEFNNYFDSGTSLRRSASGSFARKRSWLEMMTGIPGIVSFDHAHEWMRCSLVTQLGFRPMWVSTAL